VADGVIVAVTDVDGVKVCEGDCEGDCEGVGDCVGADETLAPVEGVGVCVAVLDGVKEGVTDGLCDGVGETVAEQVGTAARPEVVQPAQGQATGEPDPSGQ
jgi:hypothetical protein